MRFGKSRIMCNAANAFQDNVSQARCLRAYIFRFLRMFFVLSFSDDSRFQLLGRMLAAFSSIDDVAAQSDLTQRREGWIVVSLC